MKALQYIYTSWKNGDSLDKGYMVYSKTLGITDEECNCIKEVMQYMPPKGLKMNPTAYEIAYEFPYNFAYFILSSGRLCVANTTYLGRDYSGRFGNYIIHALIFEESELTAYPVELFGEPYIKTFMTDEELNATLPVLPLPILDIDDYGNIINDDAISEFLSERQNDCAILISAILESISKKKPIYMNDTRENLVLWMSVIQKMLPIEIAKKIGFSTYLGNHDNVRMNKKYNLLCIGVRPDANYFDYAEEKENSRHIVLDFINNIKTNNIEVSDYALKMSEYMANTLEQLNEFKTFLITTEYRIFDEKIIIAFEFYKILKEDNIKINNDILLDLIEFGQNQCQSSDNTLVATKILECFHKNIPKISILDMKLVFKYLFLHSGHMLSTIYGVLYDLIFELVETTTVEEILQIKEFFESCKKDMQLFIDGYLDYFISEEAIISAGLYLKDNTNQEVIKYYLTFILENYDLSHKTNANKSLLILFHNLLDELYKIDKSTEVVVEIIGKVVENESLYVQIIADYRKTFENEAKLDKFYSNLVKQIYSLDIDKYREIEKIMIENQRYDQVRIELFSKKIELSKTPDIDFEYYKKILSYDDSSFNIKIGLFISSYLKATKEGNHFDAVVKLFRQIDEKDIYSQELLYNMVNIIENNGIVNISKIDTDLLKTINGLCEKYEIADDIIYAVLYGRSLLKNEIKYLDKDNSFESLIDNKLNINKLSKKSYEIYLLKHLRIILNQIDDDVKLGIALNQFKNEKYLEVLISFYMDYLKSLEKNKDKIWEKAVIFSCTYIILNINTSLATLLETYLISYLQKAKEEDIHIIKKAIESQHLGSYSNVFLTKLGEEKKKKSIFSNLFKKS